MKSKNMCDPQKQFLFLFSEQDKNANSESAKNGDSVQLEDLSIEDQMHLERGILSRLEKQGY